MRAAPEGTTYYLPDGEQTPSTGSGPVWHTYFEVDGQRVAEDYGPTGTLKHHYFHNDDQNSIGLVTDDSFNVANYPNGAWNDQNEGSDVFGQPRAATGAADPAWGAGDVTRRRWINQEDLVLAHLIDLNARIYDPLLGKFMSPDPVIADQDDSQSWNAYAYSHNNPMSKQDPTGLEDDECTGSCVHVSFTGGNGGSGDKVGTRMYEYRDSSGNWHQLSAAQALQRVTSDISLSIEPAAASSLLDYSINKYGNMVSNGSSSQHMPSSVIRPNGTKAEITFNNDNPSGSSPNQLVSPRMVNATQSVVESDTDMNSMNINSTTGGKHAVNSDHQFGNAIDVNQIDGKSVRSNISGARSLENAAKGNPLTRFVCGPGGGCSARSAPFGAFTTAPGGEDHHNHVHISVFQEDTLSPTIKSALGY